MKTLKTFTLALLLVLSLSACGTNSTSLSFDETIIKEASQKTALLIDVRSESEYESGHAPEAINLPLDSLDKIDTLASSKEEVIYLYCRSGSRSQKAKQYLEEKGYNNVINLGGLSNYQGELEK